MKTIQKITLILITTVITSCGGSDSTPETGLNCDPDGLLDPVVGGWSCTNDNETKGNLVFREDGRFSETGVDVFNGIASSWVHVTQDIYIITGNGTDNVSIEFSNNNESLVLVPDKTFMDTVNCEKTACSQTKNDPVIGSWSCTNERSIGGFLVFSENGSFIESGVDIFNGIASAWFNAGQGIYTITGNGSDSVNIEFSNNNNSMTVTPDKTFMDTVSCSKN